MKKLFIIVFAFAAMIARPQAFINMTNTVYIKCWNDCTGSVTYSISGVAPAPYNVVVSTPPSCTTPTYAVNSNSTIAFNNVCPCSGSYTLTFFDGLSNQIGVRTPNFSNPGNGPLTVSAASIIPATCASCCDAKIYCNSTGGTTNMGPSVFYLDGNYLAWAFWPANGVCPGVHTLCAKDNNACQVCTTLTVGYATGVEELITQGAKLFPNPSNGTFYLNAEIIQAGTVFFITDMYGKNVHEVTITENRTNLEFDLKDLPKGIYFLRGSINGKLSSKNILLLE